MSRRKAFKGRNFLRKYGIYLQHNFQWERRKNQEEVHLELGKNSGQLQPHVQNLEKG